MHKGIAQTAAIGMAHELTGQVVYMFMTVKPQSTYDTNNEAALAKGLVPQVHKIIGLFAVPKKMYIVLDFAKDAVGEGQGRADAAFTDHARDRCRRGGLPQSTEQESGVKRQFQIMGLEDSTGCLTPKEYKQLYMARVDCHLIHGCEVSPDSNDNHVKELCDLQVNFLRQILNVHSHSMLAPLFTETGIMPLRVRRYLVLLVYLQYLLSPKLPVLARVCLKISIELARRKKSWFGDLCTAASKLPFECPPPEIANTTPKSIEEYAKFMESLTLQWLQCEVDSTNKLYLLHGRWEPQKDKPPVAITLYLRYYLTMVKAQKHREALTSLMLSTINLPLKDFAMSITHIRKYC
ncbi:hypothetical protein B0H13DRAFT_1853716 [Mycena leptocephala]|nr:hypothetical protein B0H13DRAFT_1853716 [Mycena leptocephala]